MSVQAMMATILQNQWSGAACIRCLHEAIIEPSDVRHRNQGRDGRARRARCRVHHPRLHRDHDAGGAADTSVETFDTTAIHAEAAADFAIG